MADVMQGSSATESRGMKRPFSSRRTAMQLATIMMFLVIVHTIAACGPPSGAQRQHQHYAHSRQLLQKQSVPQQQVQQQQEAVSNSLLDFLSSLWHGGAWSTSKLVIGPAAGNTISGNSNGRHNGSEHARPHIHFVRCGTPSPSAAARLAAENMTSQRLGRLNRAARDSALTAPIAAAAPTNPGGAQTAVAPPASASGPAATTALIVASIFFHVITTDDGTQGAVSHDQLAQQLAVLNRAYAICGVTWRLAGISRTANTAWFNAAMGSPEEAAMKQGLRQGSAETLNVYLVGCPSGTLGWSQFPWLYPHNPENDGSVIMYTTLPGGSYAQYNRGITIVHEAGHFLGLFHTFEGGCINLPGTGDHVLDTPAQARPTYGCPAGPVSTCPFKLADDPVHNFMNYADDSCMNLNQGLTKGQCARIQDMWKAWRAGH